MSKKSKHPIEPDSSGRAPADLDAPPADTALAATDAAAKVPILGGARARVGT